MTLDEAIKHCEDVVRFNEMYCDAEDSVSDRVKCAADHRQLAEWLVELNFTSKQVHRATTNTTTALVAAQKCQLNKRVTILDFIGRDINVTTNNLPIKER